VTGPSRARGLGLAPAVVLFAILVAHAIVETARDALFLARLGPQHLALAYLAMAGCAIGAVVMLRRHKAIDPRRLLIGFLGLATLGTGVLAATIARSASLVFVFYVWTGFIATAVVPTFWTVIDRSARISEAKRLFSRIGAGAVVGAMVGSATAGALGRVVAARHLVTVGAFAFALATVVAIALVPRTPVDAPPIRPPRAEALSWRSRRYVRRLLAVGLIATVVLTLGDLTFKRVIAERLAPDELATAFGTIYTGLNALGLVIQVAVTPRILARWGVGAALTVLPLIVIATALGFAFTGALVAMIALKIGDGGLRHSMYRVGSEILYLPVPAPVRDGRKLVADAIGQRGGQALAALIALGLAWLGVSARSVGAVTGIVGGGWLIAVVIARRAYVAQFRDTLQAGEIQRDVALPPADADSLRVLREILASPKEVEALTALELLARTARIPTRAFTHPREAVVRHALSLLDGDLRPDLVGVLAGLREHPDPEVRAAALAASCRARFDRELLVRASADPAPQVRAAALVGLASHAADAPGVDAGLAALAAGATADRLALVRAIAFSPSPRFRAMLEQVLAHDEPAVIREVLHVFANAPALVDLEGVLGFLADPGLRADARRVFVAAGPRALARLIEASEDPATSPAVLRHLPRTISRFRTAAAAAALMAWLVRELDGHRELKLLRALGRMRADDPDLVIDPAPVRDYVRRAAAGAARYAAFGDQQAALGAIGSPTAELIRDLLADKRWAAIERGFRGLGILYPRAGLRTVHDAITSGDDARRGAAREIVEATVRLDLRSGLLAALDDLAPAQRRAALGKLAPGPFATAEAFLAALLVDPSESLRCVVAYHIAEQRLVGLRGELVRLRSGRQPAFVIHAFDQAIARLDG
jgi:ATP:ADP antiporter, AAA family